MPAKAPAGLSLVHDGSFGGFLCAAAEAINAFMQTGRQPEVLAPDDLDLFSDAMAIEADQERAEKLYGRIAIRAGDASLQRILEAFCSGFGGISRSAAIMVRRLWTEGAESLVDFTNAHALAVEQASHRARAEGHLFTGILRFSELADGSWYAPIEPECNILPLIADHFCARFPDMRFAIHDTKRKSAVLHRENGDWSIVADFRLAGDPCAPQGAQAAGQGDLALESIVSGRESEVRDAWLRYFDAIAIEERRNDRLQSAHMPKRYWKYLPEKGFGRP